MYGLRPLSRVEVGLRNRIKEGKEHSDVQFAVFIEYIRILFIMYWSLDLIYYEVYIVTQERYMRDYYHLKT